MTLQTTDIELKSQVAVTLPHDATLGRTSSVRISRKVYNEFGKRVFDVVLVMMSLPLILPIIAVLAALIMLDGGSPFYTQKRVGKGGRTFRMWKLRTMVPNADALLKEYLLHDPVAAAEWKATQKLKSDPRITPIGRVLRKASMDELPQLFNVLCGTMSLVGPRPFMIKQAETYHGSAYYKLRPGITGLWQTSDRNNCDFVGRVRFDETYARVVSLQADITILIRTVRVVLRGTGY